MPCPSSRSIRMRERSRARRRRSSRTARPENAMPRSARNRPRRAGGAPAHIATYKHLRRPNLTAATPQAGRTPGPAVRTAYMPRSDGCDIGPLITGACWGAASGAGIRFSKVGICGAGFPKSIVGPRPMPAPNAQNRAFRQDPLRGQSRRSSRPCRPAPTLLQREIS
jgi:hypothetical protein